MRHLPVLALAALALTLCAGGAGAQSWCSSAGLNPTEATICADAELRRLDRRLADVYARTDGAVNGQRSWVDWRNQCGTSRPCIAQAYRTRIDSLSGASVPRDQDTALRPWCRNSPLGAAERAICSTPRLADLDAAMSAIYGATRARPDDARQLSWLRHERDACGRDRACLKEAYVNRIIELGAALPGG